MKKCKNQIGFAAASFSVEITKMTKKGWKILEVFSAENFLKIAINALTRDKSDVCVLSKDSINIGISRFELEKFLSSEFYYNYFDSKTTSCIEILKKETEKLNGKTSDILAKASVNQNCYAGDDYD